jgi:hypothetical protein
MPRVGFEPTVAVFERAKTVHTLDRAANVTGGHIITCFKTHFNENLNTKQLASLAVVTEVFIQRRKYKCAV